MSKVEGGRRHSLGDGCWSAGCFDVRVEGTVVQSSRVEPDARSESGREREGRGESGGLDLDDLRGVTLRRRSASRACPSQTSGAASWILSTRDGRGDMYTRATGLHGPPSRAVTGLHPNVNPAKTTLRGGGAGAKPGVVRAGARCFARSRAAVLVVLPAAVRRRARPGDASEVERRGLSNETEASLEGGFRGDLLPAWTRRCVLPALESWSGLARGPAGHLLPPARSPPSSSSRLSSVSGERALACSTLTRVTQRTPSCISPSPARFPPHPAFDLGPSGTRAVRLQPAASTPPELSCRRARRSKSQPCSRASPSSSTARRLVAPGARCSA